MEVNPGVWLVAGIAGAVSIGLHEWLPLEIAAVVTLLVSGLVGWSEAASRMQAAKRIK
jgi:hypothetical protein